MDIDVKPPDVSRSGVDFVVESGAIRFGLTSVKGVGRPAADAIVRARADGGPFENLFDLANRVDLRAANKLTLEALVKAGACGGLGGHRAQLVAALDTALRAAASDQADRRAGQMNLLGEVARAAPAPPLPDAEPWSEAEQARLERELTGRCWTSNPLAGHEEILSSLSTHDTHTVRACGEGVPVVVGGLLTTLQERIIRSGRNEGKRMARFRIEDAQGTLDAVMFSEAFARYRALLADHEVLVFAGDVDASREETSLRVSAVYRPDEAARHLGEIELELPAHVAVDDLRGLLERHPGSRPLRFVLSPEPGLTVALRPDGPRVDPTPSFLEAARALLGDAGVRMRATAPEMAARRERRPQGGRPPLD